MTVDVYNQTAIGRFADSPIFRLDEPWVSLRSTPGSMLSAASRALQFDHTIIIGSAIYHSLFTDHHQETNFEAINNFHDPFVGNNHRFHSAGPEKKSQSSSEPSKKNKTSYASPPHD